VIVFDSWSLQDENFGVIDEPVGNGGGHRGGVEDGSPVGKRQVSGNHGGFAFMPLTDDLEEQIGPWVPSGR